MPWKSRAALENHFRRYGKAGLLRDGGRNTVVRCRLAALASPVASVIVKHLKHDPELGFNEWASLRFLWPDVGDLLPNGPALSPIALG